MLRTVTVSVVILVVLAACGDDDGGQEATTSSPDDTSVTTTMDPGADGTAGDAVVTTTIAVTTTTTAASTTAGSSGSAVAFCLVDAESRTIDPYRGTPEEMAADVERARDLAPEFLATAPPEIEAEINIVIPIFLDVLDYVEATGYDEDQVDFDVINDEFYGATEEAQAAQATVAAYIEANC